LVSTKLHPQRDVQKGSLVAKTVSEISQERVPTIKKKAWR
jgi:hypothetical protein